MNFLWSTVEEKMLTLTEILIPSKLLNCKQPKKEILV